MRCILWRANKKGLKMIIIYSFYVLVLIGAALIVYGCFKV